MLSNQEAAVIHAADHEADLLGVCLRYEDEAPEVVPRVDVSDFFTGRHQAIFQAIQACVVTDRPASLSHVMDELTKRNAADAAGGISYLVELADRPYSPRMAGAAITRIKDAARRRGLLNAVDYIRELALNPERENPTEDAIGLLLEASQGREVRKARHIVDVIRSRVAEIERAHEVRQAGGQPVARSGFYDLDKVVVLGAGKLIILAARPGMGKTSLVDGIADNVSRERLVVLTSLEMDGEELAGRRIAADLGIDTSRQASGEVNHREDWERLVAYADRFEARKLYVDDTPSATMGHIEATARRVQAERREPIGMLVIDYLGLVDGEGKDETSKVGRIARQAKQMAKRLHCPVVLLCQLNRDVEKRDDKRPLISDLRQSGEIEQHADVVMFIYRDEYYNPQTTQIGLAEILVRKNRQGQCKTITLRWSAEETRFYGYEGNWGAAS